MASSALELTKRDDADPAHRISAIQFCAFVPPPSLAKDLRSLISSSTSVAIQSAALEALANADRKSFPDSVTTVWKTLTAQAKSKAINLLISRPEQALALLSAIESEEIDSTALSPNQQQLLRKSRSAEVKKLARKIYPREKVESRGSVIARYREALKLKGDPKRGETKYKQLCISCHRSGIQGFAVGPDTATFKSAGGESIITNLFDPNREVAPKYQAYEFSLADGQTLLGIIAHETPTHTTIRQSFGTDKTVRRKEIKSMQGLGKSLMPEGLEAGLSVQDVADLLAWIASS